METEKKIKELLESSENFRFMSVTCVNSKPHPYVIGHRHVAFASDNCGGILSEDAIILSEKKGYCHCAQPGCSLPYESHTSDRVLFLQLMRNISKQDAQKELKEIAELAGKYIDGVAFVDTPEKYRVGDE